MASPRLLPLFAFTLLLPFGCDSEETTPQSSGNPGSGGGGGQSSGTGGSGGGSACKGGQLPDDRGICQEVGLQGCADDFLDADGACRPSMAHCPDGSIPVFSTGCATVGIPDCAPEFIDDDGLCRPFASACSPGEIAVPQDGCVPLDGPDGCGSGTWGTIADVPGNVYVDPAYPGLDSDGSMAKPFTTIADALLLVTSGGRIALAAGTYTEAPLVDKAIEIEGRCPSLVTIDGNDGDPFIPKIIAVTAGPVTLRGIGIGGDGVGVYADAAAVVNLDRVAIRGALYAGMVATLGAEVTLQSTLVQDTRAVDVAQGFGVSAASGSSVTILDSTLVGNLSAGIQVLGQTTTLSVENSLIEGTLETETFYDGDGIAVLGGTADLRAVAIVSSAYSGIQVGEDASVTGNDMLLQGDPLAGLFGTSHGAYVNLGGTIELAGSVMEKNFAAVTSSGDLTVSTSLMLDFGLVLTEGTAEIHDVSLVRNQLAAISITGFSPMTVRASGVLVEDTLPYEKKHGFGIFAQGAVDIELDSVFVSKGFVAGILISEEAIGHISRSSVIGVRTGKFVETNNGPEKEAGDGIVGSKRAKVTLEAVHVKDCDRVGMLFADASGSIGWSASTRNDIGLVLDGSPTPKIDEASTIDDNANQDRVSDSKLAVPTAPVALPR